MSKSTNMLRTRRRDNSVKPNRRLDRKSSRGMIYENEELRLRTININAEVERGQYDIKKLKRENEMLKKEIWWLRDEYEKMDKMLKEKEYELSSSSTTCTSDSESCSSSCSEGSEEVETSQNIQNVQKTNMKNLHSEFDHLSIVPEENSTENSDRISLPPNDQIWNYETTTTINNDIIKPDQSYPIYDKTSSIPRNFFSPINQIKPNENNLLEIPTMEKTTTDLLVKTDGEQFVNNINNNNNSSSTFSNGGNLEELLNDIETISQDILKITTNENNFEQNKDKPFKSELNVVLMPNPMPLLGFDKYKNIQSTTTTSNFDNLTQNEEITKNPFFFQNLTTLEPSSNNTEYFQQHYNPDNYTTTETKSNNQNDGSKTNLLDLTSSELISSENEENLKFQTSQNNDTITPTKQETNEKPKLSIRRKVSIHFKGKKDKTSSPQLKPKFFDIKFGANSGGGNNTQTNVMEAKHQKTPSLESKKSTTDNENTPKTPTTTSSDSTKKKKDGRKSESSSPERKHVHVKEEKKHKNNNNSNSKHRKSSKVRRSTMGGSIDRFNRERSFSICTERSNNLLDHRLFYDEYGGNNSERERTNSLSSCDTIKTRKMSNISNIPLGGKVPWCGCWGNGCI